MALTFFTIIASTSCSKDEEQTPILPTQFLPEISKGVTSSVSINDALFNFSTNIPVNTTSIINFNEASNPKIVNTAKIRLEMNIAHTNQKDLSIILIAPDGTECEFVKRIGNDADFLITNKLRFSSQYTNSLPLTNINVPAGDYKETAGTGFTANPLISIFSNFIGKNINGNWTLKIIDHTNENDGTLNKWTLVFEQGALQ